jgi:hypothetical protein
MPAVSAVAATSAVLPRRPFFINLSSSMVGYFRVSQACRRADRNPKGNCDN